MKLILLTTFFLILMFFLSIILGRLSSKLRYMFVERLAQWLLAYEIIGLVTFGMLSGD